MIGTKSTHQGNNVEEKIQHIIGRHQNKDKVDQEHIADNKEAECREEDSPALDWN